jgi:O-antigen/teichoic acid export membrane protein
MGHVFSRVIGFFVLIYLPVAVLLSLLSKDILFVMFGEKYVVGSVALIILAWALLLNILSGPAAMLIIITKEKLAKFVPFVFFVTTLHILLNFWLIPKYSYVGASLAFLALAVVGLVIRLVFVHSLLEERPNFLEILFRPAVASLVMGAAVHLSSGLHLILKFLLAGMIYAVMLYILGEFKREEYRDLKELAQGFIKREPDEVE